MGCPQMTGGVCDADYKDDNYETISNLLVVIQGIVYQLTILGAIVFIGLEMSNPAHLEPREADRELVEADERDAEKAALRTRMNNIE